MTDKQYTAAEVLKPCPFCGSEARYGTEKGDPEFTQSGGRFIECSNKACQSSSCLMWPLKDGVDALLAERWNRRAFPAIPTRRTSDE